MKKVLFPILALVLALSLALPMAVAPAAAASPTTLTLVSSTATETAGYTTSNPSTDPLNSSLYSVPGWTSAFAVGSPVIPPWVNPTTDPVFSGSGAVWVSTIAGNYGNDLNYIPDSWRLYREVFDIPSGAVVTSAQIWLTADNAFELYFQGSSIASTFPPDIVFGAAPPLPQLAPWPFDHVYGPYALTSVVVGGTDANTIAIVVRNWDSPGAASNPTGVLYKVVVEYEEFVADPAINIEKSTRGGMTRAHEGDSIIYIYTVTNTGNVPLSNVAVTDPDVDRGPAYVSGDTNTDGELDTTETWIFRAAYWVPWFTAGPVTNTGTASGWYETTEVTDTDDARVAIVHNPDIEVTKTGPDQVGYFQTVDPAIYHYWVENTGDSALEVTLEDDVYGILVPDNGDTYLLPGDTWHYTESDTLLCEGETITCFTNKATATGIDATEQTVEDTACWTVIVFQWQPRTIGYWGNWDNHYTNIERLLNAARRQSTNINQLYGTRYFNGGVHDFLLGKPPKFKDNAVGKAWFLMEKQYLAAWFNVKSYEDWVGDIDIPDFEGSPDAAMDPDATVFLTGEAEVGLFGSTPTVMDILRYIEAHKGEWRANESVANFKTAQIVLDKLNNAENNSYGKFIPSWFDPDACPLMLENKNSTTWQVIDDDRYGKLFYDESGDTFDFLFCAAGLDAETDYSLIYYADFEDKFNVWGGNNPGALIAEMTTDGTGSVCIFGSIDLGMDLPSEPDANIDTHDYSGDPDYYANAHGAKIWLVPSTDYNGTDTVTNWNPDDFLFETDLIWYTDTDAP